MWGRRRRGTASLAVGWAIALSACAVVSGPQDRLLRAAAQAYPGIEPIRTGPFDGALAAPDADLGAYDEVNVREISVLYKAVRGNHGLPPSLEIQLARIFETALIEAAIESGRRVVYTDDPNVLQLRPAVAELEVRAPTRRSPSSGNAVHASGPWDMSLVVELRDPITHHVLYWSVMRRRASLESRRFTRTSFLSDMRRVAAEWGRYVSELLGEAAPQQP